MNLYYNGVDIYGDVSVNYCVHEMFAEKQADTLVIRFNDTKGTWSKWQPAEGDTVQFKEGASEYWENVRALHETRKRAFYDPSHVHAKKRQDKKEQKLGGRPVPATGE